MTQEELVAEEEQREETSVLTVPESEWLANKFNLAVAMASLNRFRTGLSTGAICGRRPRGWRREVVAALDAIIYATAMEVQNGN